MQSSLPKNHQLFNEQDAAQYIGMSRAYLRQDRMHGTLKSCTPGPSYYQIGSTIRYARNDLNTWFMQFKVEREIIGE